MPQTRAFLTLLAVTVLGAGLTVPALPANAASAGKATYIIDRCFWYFEEVPVFENLGHDGHVLKGSAPHFFADFLWQATTGTWTAIGYESNPMRVNANTLSDKANFHGEFNFTDWTGMIGDFSGTLTWGSTRYGIYDGLATDGSGTVLKGKVGLDPSPYLPLPTVCYPYSEGGQDIMMWTITTP